MDGSSDPAPARACWHCHRFIRLVAGGHHGLCQFDDASMHVQVDPAQGCVNWAREPGIDDEPGPPKGFQPSVKISVYRDSRPSACKALRIHGMIRTGPGRRSIPPRQTRR